MKKNTKWNRLILLNITTPIIFIVSMYIGGIEKFIILAIYIFIYMLLRLDLKCPSCGYRIDRSRLGPIVLFPDTTCRCGQDKRTDEAESVQIRAERIQKEKTRGW